MVLLGPISSIYDLLTFMILIFVIIHASPDAIANIPGDVMLFQTGWFIESLSTQTLVIFILRTNVYPFYKSRPSVALVLSSICAVTFAILLPWTPLGALFQFIVPRGSFSCSS